MAVKNLSYSERVDGGADIRPLTGADRLYVPDSQEIRTRLRTIVKKFAEAGKLTPPLSMLELDEHANEIIQANKLDSNLNDFIKILVNNAAWHEAVASVPFGRRTLLLPPCLRSAEKCRAEFDELGLICDKCGGCILCDLSDEAEKLGYAVLIAEGTSIVTSLIKEGMIDAVIGISCMQSLERTYPDVSMKALPVLAIPLVTDGCKDTEIDLEWVRELIVMQTEGLTVGLRDLTDLHDEVSSWFEEKSLRPTLKLGMTETEDISISWLLKGGKRWRPFIAVSIFNALQSSIGGKIPSKVKDLAIAIECIHKASLIYDDIQDGDDCRYGDDTLFKVHGVPVALAAALFLLGLGYRIIADCDASDAERNAMLSLATGGHCELCLGQGSELCWIRKPVVLSSDEVLDIFRHKTAPSFDVVFRLGAICAGAGQEIHDILKEYSTNIGVAYQIQDDLQDFTGGGDVDDIQCGRPSIVLALACEDVDSAERKMIASAWCNGFDAGKADDVRRIIKDSAVVEKAQALKLQYRDKALHALRHLKNRELKMVLYQVAGKILRKG
ncbi:MAG: polyprenyl synthetase family protein [Kiritimatiellae bacterium]|nr:polyprenyl synthetase family protein [Kiritimatiellia bacterium]